MKSLHKRKSRTISKHELTPGLYEVRGQIGFLGYQTDKFAYFIELYNPTNEKYCCGNTGMRHPAAGFYVKKTTARKLQPNEITKEMRKQWKKRINKACDFVLSNDCRAYQG
jgi:hypothetical protein